MKRLWIGIGFLAALLAMGIGVSAAVNRITEPVVQELTQAQEQALTGQITLAARTAQKARSDWQSHWNMVAAFADHSPMEEIDSHFAELEIYGRAEEAADFAATCASLARLVQAVSQAHLPTWWNLF